MKKNIDELTSVCFISDNLSIRANISGLDIVRVLYDLPAKIQPPTPQEVKYAKKKEDKKKEEQKKEEKRLAKKAKKKRLKKKKKNRDKERRNKEKEKAEEGGDGLEGEKKAEGGKEKGK